MIRLEPFGNKDFKHLIDWITDAEILRDWSGSMFRFPLTEDSLEWYIRGTNDLANSDALVYKAVDDTGEMVGHISLGGISRKNRSARVTRVLVGNRAGHGKGICQQMVRAVLQIGFEELELHRISLGVYDNNPAATRCYEKTGFIIEGINRDILWHKNAWYSMIEMSILENEWKNLFKSPGQATGIE